MSQKTLNLHVTKKWFDMTKSGLKTEDYREINDYWVRRLIEFDNDIEADVLDAFINDLQNCNERSENPSHVLDDYGARLKVFYYNCVLHAYPKKTDIGKKLLYYHEGIEIREGNPENGAEQGKIYFCIMHRNINE